MPDKHKPTKPTPDLCVDGRPHIYRRETIPGGGTIWICKKCDRIK